MFRSPQLRHGANCDSLTVYITTAVLLRWLEDPSSRDFDLSDAIILTAMVGDEFADTGRLVTRHVLPRLRANRVRFVQVARAGRHQGRRYHGLGRLPRAPRAAPRRRLPAVLGTGSRRDHPAGRQRPPPVQP